jgi:hypothetical protein
MTSNVATVAMIRLAELADVRVAEGSTICTLQA